MVVAIGRPQMFSFSCTETRDSSIQEEKVHLFDPNFTLERIGGLSSVVNHVGLR